MFPFIAIPVCFLMLAILVIGIAFIGYSIGVWEFFPFEKEDKWPIKLLGGFLGGGIVSLPLSFVADVIQHYK